MKLASVALCLLTPRSFEKPWVLYEAGLAHGMGKKLFALLVGIPISRVTPVGPFGQFQLRSDNPASIAGLIKQLAIEAERQAIDDHVAAETNVFLSHPSIVRPAHSLKVEADAIHHVSLAVRDLERSRRFYVDVLGLKQIERPGFIYNGAELKGLWLGLPGGATASPSPDRCRYMENAAYSQTD